MQLKRNILRKIREPCCIEVFPGKNAMLELPDMFQCRYQSLSTRHWWLEWLEVELGKCTTENWCKLIFTSCYCQEQCLTKQELTLPSPTMETTRRKKGAQWESFASDGMTPSVSRILTWCGRQYACGYREISSGNSFKRSLQNSNQNTGHNIFWIISIIRLTNIL